MPNCFVIMPFRPELKFFYRAIKAHVEQAFPDVTVERGDDRVLTRPILEKIADFIRQADVVIADCSGRNPNVFYELGMAHALGKPVVLITSDAVEEAPTDVRAFEFISYAQLGDDVFLTKLDDALQSAVGNPFAALYPEAVGLFDQFRAAKNLHLAPATQDEFQAAMRTMHSQGQPLPKEPRRRAEFLVRRLLGPDPEIQVLTHLKEWLTVVFP
jgi:hypothetical protein